MDNEIDEEEQARLDEQRYEAREEFFKERLLRHIKELEKRESWYTQVDADIGYQKEHGE